MQMVSSGYNLYEMSYFLWKKKKSKKKKKKKSQRCSGD